MIDGSFDYSGRYLMLIAEYQHGTLHEQWLVLSPRWKGELELFQVFLVNSTD
jgi:hypothetical protein